MARSKALCGLVLSLLACSSGSGAPAPDGPSAPIQPSAGNPPPAFVPAAYYQSVKAALLAGDRVGASAIRVAVNGDFTFVPTRFDDAIAQLNAINASERGVVKNLTFSAVADVSAHIADVPKDITWIGLDIEPGITPAEEIDPSQYVATVQRFASLVHASGRKASWGPIFSAFDGLEKAGRLADVLGVVDAAVYQGQQLYKDQGAAALASELHRQRVIVKGHNAAVAFNVQLWVTDQTPDEVIAGFNLTRTDLDLAIVGAPASVPWTDIQHILAGFTWR